MIRLRALVLLCCCSGGLSASLFAQQSPEYHLKALNDQGWAEYDLKNHIGRGTNGVIFDYGGAVLTADSMSLNEATGEVVADGSVRIQREEQLWVGDHVIYNYTNHQIEAEQFRSGKPPVFIAGEGLHAEHTNEGPLIVTNLLLRATNAYITTDDIAEPVVKIRAKSITIIPGQKVIARHATLCIGDVPIFYFPYYERNLGPRANTFNFVPGFRSSYGAYLLSSYHWFLNEELDAILHADYRVRRGVGLGPDLNYHLGSWGEGFLRYYYLHDLDPHASLTNDVPRDRQRIYFTYLANPVTNLSVRSQIRYQTDLGVLHDFLEGEYVQNPQPSSYLEVDKLWQNFSLDLYAQPRLNTFLETVERLPDLRLTGYRQQLWESPLFYESETSAGYYRRRFADTNNLFSEIGPYSTSIGINSSTNNYAAARADTYHQIVMPETFFGWLNFTPRVGGRFTYYSSASGPGAMTEETSRGVFNTGAELSFKASRVWPEVQSKFLEMDGLRHIIEPSFNYVYVPNPNRAGTNEIPQFDSELPSLRLLPIEFPDYNSIDSIDSQNVVRLGLRNKFQTKRGGAVVNLANWDLYTDWRLQPRPDQNRFADVFSDLTLRPRSWLTFESLTRYDVSSGALRLAFHTLTFQPNDVWSWGLSHFYLRDQINTTNSYSPTALGEGNSVFTSNFFYRLNENWGLRAAHRFDVRDGRMQEQSYSVYRDFRSWTAALTFRLRDNPTGPEDFGVAFTFSIKAFPKFSLGTDAVRPYYLLGN
jgi:lipopolysaccharide assembly outer membrane protein LptD (OstA)